jgi:hypothetical protein
MSNIDLACDHQGTLIDISGFIYREEGMHYTRHLFMDSPLFRIFFNSCLHRATGHGIPLQLEGMSRYVNVEADLTPRV